MRPTFMWNYPVLYGVKLATFFILEHFNHLPLLREDHISTVLVLHILPSNLGLKHGRIPQRVQVKIKMTDEKNL